MSANITSAATSPSLGSAGTYGLLGGTFTPNGGSTTITGDVGYTTLSAGLYTVVGGTNYGAGDPTPTARTNAGTALTNLNNQACTFTFPGGAIDLATDTTHGLIGVYTPGVYCVNSTASIGTAGIYLNGAGTYIFKVVGALTSVANSSVVLAGGASSYDVFWAPTAATTLAANTTFAGTLIDNANAITVGANTTWKGRALSLGAGVITTDTDTITSTCSVGSVVAPVPASGHASTINVVKMVINDNGGTKKVSDFPLFVNGTPVVSGETNNFQAPGPAYTITEISDPNYTRTFSGDCDSNGQIGLIPGNNKFCIVTNNDIGAPVSSLPTPPMIDVVKVPSPLSLPAGPGTVNYTYTLKNIGTVPVTDITMVGDTCGPIVLFSGDLNNDSKLDVTETWVYRCSTTLTETHTNTVTTHGWANGLSTVDIASATVVVGKPIVPPLIHVTKIPSPLILPVGGGIVTYVKRVTNPGTIALSNIRVTDDKCSPVEYVSGDLNKDLKLDPTEMWTYLCRSNLSQTTTNTATASGEANGLTATDIAVATVLVPIPGLPNTGINIISWGIVTLAGLFGLSLSFYFARKKQLI
ncbi:MAG: ice-binding family protein [Candidatus Parcubacteria bacterium]|nr:ice-binding family protein [Candidatus Parcubacteria bacterium]